MGNDLTMASGGDQLIAPWWAPFLAAGSAVVTGLGLWLANRLLGKAAFQGAINSGFSTLVEQIQEERALALKQYNDDKLLWAAERAQLRGDILNLTQAVESLKALLRRRGIEIPDLPPHGGLEMLTIHSDKKDHSND